MKKDLVATNGPKSGKEVPKSSRLGKIKRNLGKSYWDNLISDEGPTLEPEDGVFVVPANRGFFKKAKRVKAKKIKSGVRI